MPKPLRFPRCARLRASAEFQAVFGEGSRVSGASLRVQVRFAPAAPAPKPVEARLGLTVGKRVDKRAVARNRIRRVLRDTFRLVRAGLPPGDYVVQAKPEARTASNATLRTEFTELLTRAARRAPLPGHTPDGTMPALAARTAAPNSPDSPPSADGAHAPPLSRP